MKYILLLALAMIAAARDRRGQDTRWLAQVIEARRSGDSDSLVFLTHRRIARDKRRLFAMLVARFAESAD